MPTAVAPQLEPSCGISSHGFAHEGHAFNIGADELHQRWTPVSLSLESCIWCY